MKNPWRISSGILCTFFLVTLAVAYLNNRHFPMLTIGGEKSVGTWISGVLLILSAGIALVIGMRSGWFPWLLVFVFFLLLAADERFMFHERLKEEIKFSLNYAQTPKWIFELPVILGACVGLLITWLLWKHLERGRAFLIVATILGAASVTFDVLAFGVFWEECFKLIAELSITVALLGKAAQFSNNG